MDYLEGRGFPMPTDVSVVFFLQKCTKFVERMNSFVMNNQQEKYF
ncbi:hypothetical protein Cal7507_4689 [Calothrix sp. PCC 7507]|nr:hypothetical protein Cal7507_4689 [Calothrix sp. PCC 7507]